MVRSLIAFVTALTAAVAHPSATPPSPATAKPLVWEVKWDQARCLLMRRTQEARPLAFVVAVTPGLPRVELWLANGPERVNRSQGFQRFDLVTSPGNDPPLKVALGTEMVPGSRILTMSAGSGFLDRLGRSASLTIADGQEHIVDFDLAGAAKAVAALRECEDGILREWGVDPAALAGLRKLPKVVGRPPDILEGKDYPREALRARATGLLLVRLDVTAAGRVSACAVVRSSGRADLDDRGCELWVRNGRFEPGLGADGAPSPAKIVSMFVWSLPPH